MHEVVHFDGITKLCLADWFLSKKSFSLTFKLFLLDNQDKVLIEKGEIFSIEVFHSHLVIKFNKEIVFTSTFLLPSHIWHEITLNSSEGVLKIMYDKHFHPCDKNMMVQLDNSPFLLGYTSKDYLIKDFIFSTESQSKYSLPFDSDPKILLEFHPLASLSELENWKNNSNQRRSTCPLLKKSSRRQKVVHCHDMMGGYHDDRFSQGLDEKFHTYNFYKWNYIDIFIYFAHHRVTIPPPQWIDAAHKNGCQILGTFITEWEGGLSDNKKLVNDPEKYADKLIAIAKHYNFDGWFFNIESDFENEEDALKMVSFLKLITSKIHKEIPNSLILWYDSVILTTGKVKWQNELNELNKAFFDACDAIFLNYGWKPEMIENSSKIAGDRSFDVFTGIDVWARGCLGGFDSHVSVDLCNKNQTSIGLFAPAWTYEIDGKFDRTIFEAREDEFWENTKRINLLKDWKYINGGNGWKEISRKLNESPIFVTSHQICTRSQIIDLHDQNVVLSNLIKSLPPIHVSEWIRGTGPNFKDFARIKVALLDEDMKILDEFDAKDMTISENWYHIHHVFSNYDQNVRFISWYEEGKDSENWAGHFGSQFALPELFVIKHERPTFLPRSLETTFYTCFGNGIGKHYFRQGNKVRSKIMNNLSFQDLQPNFISTEILLTKFEYEDAWNGTNSIQITCLGSQKSPVTLFNLDLKVNDDDYLLFHIIKGDPLDFSVIYDDESVSSASNQCVNEVNGWKTFKTFLTKGKTTKSIQMCTMDRKSQFLLGCIAILKENQKTIPKIENFDHYFSWNPSSIARGTDIVDLNLKWNETNIDYCEIHLDQKFTSRSHGGIHCIENLPRKDMDLTIIPYFQGKPSESFHISISKK